MLLPLLQRLNEGLLVADGAMGTMIYNHGIPLSQCFDQLNVTQPDLIRGIHRAYVEAGAEAIETNTFTTNRHRLARFGLEEKVREFNQAAVKLAREAAEDKAYVLASLGPLRDRASDELDLAASREIFSEQISALVEAAPDALLFETFTTVDELELALEQARRLTSLPLIAQVVVDDAGYTRDGRHISVSFRHLREAGAHVVGINCAKGPNGIITALREVPLDEGLLLSAFPNAGLPAYVEGR